MSAVTPQAVVVVYCSLLLLFVTANGSKNARTRYFHGNIDEDAQRFRNAAVGHDATATCCGPSSTDRAVLHDARLSRDIPLNVIMELNQVANISDLFNKFMPNVDMREAQKLVATTGFQSRTATFNVERKAATTPKSAGCSPENRSVNLKDTDDPSLYYYPACTRVNRCGGCCGHDLLSCQPTKVEILNFEVAISQYVGAGKLEFVGRKAISVEQHLKCKCDCVIKEKDCNQFQTYNPNECQCVCSNEDEQNKCNEEYNLKLWNPATCSCQCREIQECTSGFIFDPNTCRCEPGRIKTKNTVYETFNRNRYNVGEK